MAGTDFILVWCAVGVSALIIILALLYFYIDSDNTALDEARFDRDYARDQANHLEEKLRKVEDEHAKCAAAELQVSDGLRSLLAGCRLLQADMARLIENVEHLEHRCEELSDK